ncbi:S-adenosyl-L-methionine-dependent methyltransferase [Lentinula edodes]|nr:S-adenosyl-L-methionine-dependent methyltransferase [Lentinula edodes]
MASTRSQVETLVSYIQQAAQDALAEYERTSFNTPSLDSIVAHPLDDVLNTIALKRAIRMLEGACDQLCTTLAPPAHTIINRAQDTYWACLRVAVENNIPDALAGYPSGIHVSELSNKVNIEPGKLLSILRLLAARHCFKEIEQNVFTNNRLSITLLSSNPLAAYTTLLTRESQIAAYHLTETLADPKDGPSQDPQRSPFVRSLKDSNFKGTYYDYLSTNEDRRNAMSRGMIAMNAVIGTLSIIDIFPWSNFSTLCDVGSGIGAFSMSLLEHYPHIQITLHDRKETIALAEETWKQKYSANIEAGQILFTPGDFLEDIPAKGFDLYYVSNTPRLRNILHNWPDAQSIQILQAVRRAAGRNSHILIHDYVMQPLSRGSESKVGGTQLEIAPTPLLPSFGSGNIRLYEQDMLMLNIYNAKERTIEEVVELGHQANLRLEKVWDLAETSVLEFVTV